MGGRDHGTFESMIDHEQLFVADNLAFVLAQYGTVEYES